MAAPAAGKGRKRLQLTISEDLDAEITQVCKAAHMSKSAWIEYTLAMAIRSYSDLLASMSKAMATGVGEGLEIREDAR